MCVTVLWSIDAQCFDERFAAVTSEMLGTAPEPSPLRIASSRVPTTAATFTLTRRMCDCDALVGLGDASLVDGELTGPQLLAWLERLAAATPRLRRVALLRAWSPSDPVVAPKRARGVRLSEVDEPLLRSIEDDMLLTIDLR